MGYNRRKLLRTTGSAIAIGGLAGCSGDGGDGGGGGDGGSDGGMSDGDDGGGGDGGDGGGGGDGGDGGSTQFPQEDITFHIPYGPGGSFDAYTRAAARFLPEHLPNDVNVRAQNTEGAGGQRMIREINNADPTGYQIASYNIPGFISTQVLGTQDWDMREIPWLGRISAAPYLLFANNDTPYETVDDLRNASGTVQIPAIAKYTSEALFKVIVSNELGIETNMVFGYEGAPETVAAVQRGEADVGMTSFDTARPVVEEGNVQPLASFSPEPPEYGPDIPTSEDVGLGHLTDVVSFQITVGTTPGILDEYPDRHQILEDAVHDTVTSDQMQQWAEENNRPALAAARPDEVDQVIENGFEVIRSNQDIIAEKLG